MISTHAPAGGATYWEILFEQWDAFLLTPLREGRRTILFSICSALHISTHAPAGGATRLMGQGHWEVRLHFYSRPCGRGDSESTRTVPLYGSFLLTPLREGRLFCPSSGNRASRYPHFPPRPAHWSAVQPDAGRTLRETVGKEESAPTHPWQNQSSSAGSASQTTGSKALGLNPICTPLGTLSRETSAS